MFYAAAAVFLSLWLAVPAISEPINGNPNFLRGEGGKPYRCTTPQGDRVLCNKWQFSRNGWRNVSITRNKTVFSKLKDRYGRGVELLAPENKRVALYDGSWADHRDYSVIHPWDEEAVFEEFVVRELKPAQFHQFIEIREEGQYQLESCMAAKFYDDQLEWEIAPGAGIQVVLEEWHRDTVNEPTVHVTLPHDKAKFGPGVDIDGGSRGPTNTDYEIGSMNMTWVDSYEDLPLMPERGQVVGVRWEESAYAWDGHRWFFVGHGFGAMGIEVDSYPGHAGLTTEYHEPDVFGNVPDEVTQGEWTCHSVTIALGPGFYALRGQALPISRDVFGIPHVDYDGFASIKNISLNKIDIPQN